MNSKAIQSIQWMVTHLIRLQPYHMLQLKHLPVEQPSPTLRKRQKNAFSNYFTPIHKLCMRLHEVVWSPEESHLNTAVQDKSPLDLQWTQSQHLQSHSKHIHIYSISKTTTHFLCHIDRYTHTEKHLYM